MCPQGTPAEDHAAFAGLICGLYSPGAITAEVSEFCALLRADKVEEAREVCHGFVASNLLQVTDRGLARVRSKLGYRMPCKAGHQNKPASVLPIRSCVTIL